MDIIKFQLENKIEAPSSADAEVGLRDMASELIDYYRKGVTGIVSRSGDTICLEKRW